jgi:hypothetical protein
MIALNYREKNESCMHPCKKARRKRKKYQKGIDRGKGGERKCK